MSGIYLPVIEILVWIATTAVIVLTAQLILGPIVARFTISHPVRRESKEIDFSSLPTRVAEFIVAGTAGLVDDGFTPAAHLQFRADMNQDAYVSILVNRADGAIAEVICVKVRGGAGIFGAAYIISLLTRFSDGLMVSTGNSRLPPIFEDGPGESSINLRHVTDPRLLYRVHCARVARVAPARRTWGPEPGEEVQDHFDRSYNTLTEQVVAGSHWLDEPAQRFRLTWRGAFVTVVKLMFPLKQIRIRMRDRAADAELRAIGLYDQVKFKHRPRMHA
jgi:hypothetical protein